MSCDDLLSQLDCILLDWSKFLEREVQGNPARKRLFGPNKEKCSKNWLLKLEELKKRLSQFPKDSNSLNCLSKLKNWLLGPWKMNDTLMDTIQEPILDFLIAVLVLDNFSKAAKVECTKILAEFFQRFKAKEFGKKKELLLYPLTTILEREIDSREANELQEAAATLLNETLSSSVKAKEYFSRHEDLLKKVVDRLMSASDVVLQFQLACAILRVCKKSANVKREFGEKLERLCALGKASTALTHYLQSVDPKHPTPKTREFLSMVNSKHNLLKRHLPVSLLFTKLVVNGERVRKDACYLDFNEFNLSYQAIDDDRLPRPILYEHMHGFNTSFTAVADKSQSKLTLTLVVSFEALETLRLPLPKSTAERKEEFSLAFKLSSIEALTLEDTVAGIQQYFANAGVANLKISSPKKAILIGKERPPDTTKPIETPIKSLQKPLKRKTDDLGYDEHDDKFFHRKSARLAQKSRDRRPAKRSLKSLDHSFSVEKSSLSLILNESQNSEKPQASVQSTSASDEGSKVNTLQRSQPDLETEIDRAALPDEFPTFKPVRDAPTTCFPRSAERVLPNAAELPGGINTSSRLSPEIRREVALSTDEPVANFSRKLDEIFAAKPEDSNNEFRVGEGASVKQSVELERERAWHALKESVLSEGLKLGDTDSKVDAIAGLRKHAQTYHQENAKTFHYDGAQGQDVLATLQALNESQKPMGPSSQVKANFNSVLATPMNSQLSAAHKFFPTPSLSGSSTMRYANPTPFPFSLKKKKDNSVSAHGGAPQVSGGQNWTSAGKLTANTTLRRPTEDKVGNAGKLGAIYVERIQQFVEGLSEELSLVCMRKRSYALKYATELMEADETKEKLYTKKQAMVHDLLREFRLKLHSAGNHALHKLTT